MVTLAALVSIGLCSCKPTEEPNPENRDPIYADLQAEQKRAASAAADTKKKIEEINSKIKTLQYPSPILISSKNDREVLANQLLQQDQAATYYQIRAEQRLEHDRREYHQAFVAGREWPDSKEYEEYKKIKALRSASRNWSDRVPKTNRYGKPVKGGESAGTKSAEKPSGEAKAETPKAE